MGEMSDDYEAYNPTGDQLNIEKLKVKLAYVAKQIEGTKASLQVAGEALPLDDVVKLRQRSVRIANLADRLDRLHQDHDVFSKRLAEARAKQEIPPELPPGDYRFWVVWTYGGSLYRYLVLGLPNGQWYTTSVSEKGPRTWEDLMLRFRTKSHMMQVQQLTTVDRGTLSSQINAVSKPFEKDDED